MSTATISTTFIPTATVEVVQAPTEATGPPIVHIARYLLESTSIVVRYTIWFTHLTVTQLAIPLSLLLRVLLYLFGPIYHLATAFFHVFVIVPCNVVIHLAHDLYPFYVFITITCICSALIGWIARLIMSHFQAYFWSPPAKTSAVDAPTVTGAPNGRKRVLFKGEHQE